MRIRAPVLAVFLAVLAVPDHAGAQQEGGREAHAYLGASLGTTRLHDQTSTMAGGALLLSLDGRLAFGGGGWVMLGGDTVEGQASGSRYDFRMSYGGLMAQARILGRPRAALELRTLVGAANAKVRLPVVNTLIAADNFGVVEPEVVGSFRILPGLDAQASVAWRWTFGVQDLPGLSPNDLRGFSARIGLAIENF